MARFVTPFLIVLILAATPTSAQDAAIGKAAPDFTLRDPGGAAWSPREMLSAEGARAVVVCITSTTCPYSLRAEKELVPLAKTFAERGVRLLALYPNRTEGLEGLGAHASGAGIGYPVVLDAGGVVARAWGAEVTPTFFLLDQGGILRYRGNLESLVAAVDCVLGGSEVAEPVTAATGCTIQWPEEEPAESPAEPVPPPGGAGAEGPRSGEGPFRDRPRRPELSEAGKVWLDRLLESLAADDPVVRRSAAAGIDAFGPLALPRLRETREGAEGPFAQELDRLIERAGRMGPRGPERPAGEGPGAGGGPGGFRAGGSILDRQKTMLMESLELTESQRAAVEEAFAGFRKREEELRGFREEGDREGFRAGMEALFGEVREKLVEILTPEQLQRLEEMRSRRGGGRRGFGPR